MSVIQSISRSLGRAVILVHGTFANGFSKFSNIFLLFGCIILMNSCCSSTQVSTGQVDFYSSGTRSAVSNLELQIGNTSILDMRTGGGFYGASCLVRSENPKVVAAKRDSSQRLVLEGLVEGETRVTVQCGGMAGGEQAVCDARFENTGSVVVKVVKAVRPFSD